MNKLDVFVDAVGGEPGDERGERPVMVKEDAHCDECGQRHDIEACPKCGAFIELGYGLIFGGCGEYKFCSAEGCDWFWKREDTDG